MLTAIMITFIITSVVTFFALSLSRVEHINWPLYIQTTVVALALLYIFAQGVIVGLKGY